ncbi:MAG: GerMN domain-containing protein [Chloroflexi bacterium]|nr:GerMN domain-containing protein [Chloroflexota bacterium]
MKHLWLIVCAIGLVACSSATPSTPTPTIAPTQAPTTMAMPTIITVPVVATPVVIPTLVLTQTQPTALPARTLTATRPAPTTTLAAGTMRVKLFFVALEDNGKSGKKIGCDDSIIAVERAIPATTAPLTAVLRELLAVRDTKYGQSGLHNALAMSDLKIESVSVINERAEIRLSGSLKLGGVCDNPRVDAQIKETALQFATVKRVAVWINGKPLETLLSDK